MLPWNVARSRAPAQLSNPVGIGALNLKHDVALLQVLLRAARQPTGNAYYTGPIDGRFGPKFAEALAGFRAERAPATGAAPTGPLHAWDPAFQALARLDPTLAVLHGTATVYSTEWNPSPPTVDQGYEPLRLSAQMLAGLQNALADIQRTTGIRFDARVELTRSLPPSTRARLIPRGLKILSANGGKHDVVYPLEFERVAPELAKALRDVVDNLMAQRVGLSAAARAERTPQPDPLSFTLRSEADRVEQEARDTVTAWRQRGWRTAARFYEFYLDGRGRGDRSHPDFTLSHIEALSFEPIRDAIQGNIRTFIARNIEADPPKTNEPAAVTAMTNVRKHDGTTEHFTDYWQYLFRYADLGSREKGKERLPNINLSLLTFTQGEFVRVAGETTFKSTGDFTVTRQGNSLWISAKITHLWADIYDFHIVNKSQAELLERDRGARPFSWQAQWVECYFGTMTLENEWTKPFSQVACSGFP